MSDTRALLNRIAEFRQRIEAMPKLVPMAELVSPPLPVSPTAVDHVKQRVEAGSRTQAILESSLRQLENASSVHEPMPLTNRARRLLIDAQGLVARLKALADDPLLAGPPPNSEGMVPEADVHAVHYRETAAMTESLVRFALSFPDSASEQARLCEGLEGMLDAAHRRFSLLAHSLERRRLEVTRVDVMARFLAALCHGIGPLDPSPVIELTHTLIAEEPGQPLRLLHELPEAVQVYLGGPAYPAPARFIASHAINCAKVMVRLVRHDPEWRMRPHEPVLAALLHDVGMLKIEPSVLAHAGPLSQEKKREIEKHAHVGAELIADRIPSLASLMEPIANHHERSDGTGYPMGLTEVKQSPLARLLAMVDVYVALLSPRAHRGASDPRSVLTDVLLLADRGHLDRFAAEKFLTLGFYPPGTVVEMADGSTGVVMASRDPRLALSLAGRPMLALLADSQGRPLATPRYVDLAERDAGTVVRALDPFERMTRLGRHYPEWV